MSYLLDGGTVKDRPLRQGALLVQAVPLYGPFTMGYVLERTPWHRRDAQDVRRGKF